jgi:hypothetical protein
MDSRLEQLARELFSQADVGVLNPAEIGPRLLPHIFMLDIERDKIESKKLQLRVRLAGSAVDRIVGRPSKSMILENFVHGPRGSLVIDGFHHCANTHEPLWMRQVVLIEGKLPRFVEGIAIYFEPERICGGLVAEDLTEELTSGRFERQVLSRPEQAASPIL